MRLLLFSFFKTANHRQCLYNRYIPFDRRAENSLNRNIRGSRQETNCIHRSRFHNPHGCRSPRRFSDYLELKPLRCYPKKYREFSLRTPKQT